MVGSRAETRGQRRRDLGKYYEKKLINCSTSESQRNSSTSIGRKNIKINPLENIDSQESLKVQDQGSNANQNRG